MYDAHKISDRLVHQRLRNRMIEAISILADGKTGVRAVGYVDYFETFYDYVPHTADGPMHVNDALSEDERTAILRLRTVIDRACDATPRQMSDEDFIASGWPDRISAVARDAHALMLRRGRFSEEEDAPSK